MTQWVEVLPLQSNELSFTPGSHGRGENQLPKVSFPLTTHMHTFELEYTHTHTHYTQIQIINKILKI